MLPHRPFGTSLRLTGRAKVVYRRCALANKPDFAVSVPVRNRGWLVFQLVATLGVLAFLPGNALKVVVLLGLWVATFAPLTRRELAVFGVVCTAFSVMDAMAVRAGVFAFTTPDVLSLPLWEFFMWGFYVLHVVRMLDGPVPGGSPYRVATLAVVFAVPFMTIVDQDALFIVSAAALGVVLWAFHEREDWLYLGYMVLMGAAFEYMGVLSGLWRYPADPPGGVPLWFITMWGGVGLFTRRLVLPLLRPGTVRIVSSPAANEPNR